LTEVFGLFEAGIKMSEDIDPNEHKRLDKTCYDDSQKENKWYLSRQTSVPNCVKSHSNTHAIQPILLDIGNGSDDPPTVKEEVPAPQIVNSFPSFLLF
jgi:hypothetical protein